MKTQNKKEQYEKVVEWENEEYIWIPIFILLFWSIGYYMGTYPMIFFEIHIYLVIVVSLTFVALMVNSDKVTRKVYWVKK